MFNFCQRPFALLLLNEILTMKMVNFSSNMFKHYVLAHKKLDSLIIISYQEFETAEQRTGP